MALRTIKVHAHPDIDYKEWAQELYGKNKCIVSAIEDGKQGNKPHVHFIGYTDLQPEYWKLTKDKLNQEHPKRDEEMWCHEDQKMIPRWGERIQPVREGDVAKVTELGFQYVMKTSKKPEYCQGFTVEELNELKEKSDDHVKKLKSGMKEHCHARSYTGTALEVADAIYNDCDGYSVENNVKPRPGCFQNDIVWIMRTHPACDDEWKRFIKRQRVSWK